MSIHNYIAKNELLIWLSSNGAKITKFEKLANVGVLFCQKI